MSDRISFRINCYPLLLVISLFCISFGSTGSGFFNNYNISVYLGYYTLIFILFYRVEFLKFFESNYFIPVFGLLTVFFISSIMGMYFIGVDVWYRYFSILSCILFGYCNFILINNYKINLKSILIVLTVFGTLHVFFLVFFGFNLDDYKNHNWAMVLPFFNNIRNLTDFLVICFLTSIYLFFVDESKYKVFYFVSTVLILACLLWSGSRSSLLAGFVSLFFILFYLNGIVKNIINLTFIFSFSIVFSYLFRIELQNFGFMNSILRSTESSFNKLSSSRLDVYEQVISLIVYKPFWGYGGEAVRKYGVNANGMSLGQAHNFCLQILLEYGIIGFIFFLWIMLKFISKQKNERIGTENLIFYALLLNIIVSSFFNGGFYYIATLSLFCLFFSCVCSINNRNLNEL